ncbi:hypothetical protein NKDENANG_03922 [Candidatus Entotheonellaceae bacterium PAL068K]
MPNRLRETGGVLDVGLDTVDGGEELQAQYPELQLGPHLCLTVRNTGHGMEPEVIERIFDPFCTTKEVGQKTGMGLAVAQGMRASHGGAITVQSILNHGTPFTISYLPRSDDAVSSESLALKPIPRGRGGILILR